MAQRSVSIRTDGNSLLRGTLFDATLDGVSFSEKALRPAALFLHGWKSDQRAYLRRAEAVEKLGYICLTFDLRGHGTSDGRLEELTIHDHLNDVVDAYRFISSREFVDKDRIHVVGASYGAYLAAVLSGKEDVRSLVLRAPSIYSNQDFDRVRASIPDEQVKAYGNVKHGVGDNIALEAVGKFKGRILMIESEFDKTIPRAVIESYLGAISKDRLTRETIKGAEHTLSNEVNDIFIGMLVDWFEGQKQMTDK